jgi:hypothetical protein
MRAVKAKQFRERGKATLIAWFALVNEGKADKVPFQLHDLFGCVSTVKRNGSCPCGATLDTGKFEKEEHSNWLKGNLQGGQHLAAVARLAGVHSADLATWLADLAEESGYYRQDHD